MKKKRKNKKKRFYTLIVSIASFILFIFLSALGGYFFVRHQIFSPVAKQAESQTFIVEKGNGLKIIARKLEKAGLIRNDIWFLSYATYRGWSSKMQAGEYNLNPSLNISQIAQKIASGDIIIREIKVTILEGLTLKQIDEQLAQTGLIEPGEISQYIELEGFLFPDTYNFNTKDKADDIIQKMKDNFNLKVDEGLRVEIERQGKTLKEIITMASIIEKEVPTYYDKRLVSGIFWKRLGINYPLQSCATLAYILGVNKWRYSVADTKIDSPYNTYKNAGLPPGPINHPGIWSIKAAIWPQHSDFFFFLSSRDGKTIFSRTFEEHTENKMIYLD